MSAVDSRDNQQQLPLGKMPRVFLKVLHIAIAYAQGGKIACLCKQKLLFFSGAHNFLPQHVISVDSGQL